MPEELHEHLAPDGETVLGYTRVVRESPWDDATRERALALTEYEESLCGCGCGQPVSAAHNPDEAWFVDSYTCYAEKARERVARQKRQQKERNSPNGTPPEGWDDGLHYTVRPHDPDRDKPKQSSTQTAVNPRRLRGQRAD